MTYQLKECSTFSESLVNIFFSSHSISCNVSLYCNLFPRYRCIRKILTFIFISHPWIINKKNGQDFQNSHHVSLIFLEYPQVLLLNFISMIKNINRTNFLYIWLFIKFQTFSTMPHYKYGPRFKNKGHAVIFGFL